MARKKYEKRLDFTGEDENKKGKRTTGFTGSMFVPLPVFLWCFFDLTSFGFLSIFIFVTVGELDRPHLA